MGLATGFLVTSAYFGVFRCLRFLRLSGFCAVHQHSLSWTAGSICVADILPQSLASPGCILRHSCLLVVCCWTLGVIGFLWEPV